MEWRDDGIVIGVRQHGETSVVLDLLTREHGRHLGYVHGGRSRRLRACLQPGNTVEAFWKARVEEHMGTYTVEPRVLRASRVLDSALALHTVNHLCALARLLPEREPHGDLHGRLEAILDRAEDRVGTPALMVMFELTLLTELGFGLDLDRCAATGSKEDLVYVSPKTGRAVCRAAGEPYRGRMLTLPGFLLDEDSEVAATDVAAGFLLAEHFLNRDVFAPRGLAFSAARNLYIKAVAG